LTAVEIRIVQIYLKSLDKFKAYILTDQNESVESESESEDEDEDEDEDESPGLDKNVKYNLDELKTLISLESNSKVTNEKHYQCVLRILKGTNKQNFRFDDISPTNQAGILTWLNGKKISNNTKKNYLHTIFRLYRIFNVNCTGTPLGLLFDELDGKEKARVETKTLSEKSIKIFEHNTERNTGLKQILLNNFEKDEDGKYDYSQCSLYTLQKYLIFLLYKHKTPPLRTDYFNMGIDLNNPKKNYIDTDDMTIHMNDYKNIERRGPFTFNLNDWDDELVHIMKVFIKRKQTELPDTNQYLLISVQNKEIKMSNSTKILNSIFGTGISVNTLRKLYVSNIPVMFKNTLTPEILEKIDLIMCHTRSTANDHYNFIEAKV
jgi:hypothetical protein